MKVTQIAEILNAVYGTLLGGDTIPNPAYNPELPSTDPNYQPETIPNPGLFKEDLSNVVDVGAKIKSTTAWGDNFDKYVGKLIDKVGRVIFRDRVYSGDSLGLRREAQDYGSVLEKIRVEVGDFKINNKWRQTAGNVLPDGTSLSGGKSVDYSHLFDFDEPAQVEALYFNILDTYKLTICLPKDQMEGAFRSSADMQRFFGMITNRIMTKFEVALEQLDEAAEANFIGAKLHYGSNVVDLLAAYKAESGDATITAATALESKEFLRYCVRRIKTDKKLMARFSGKYNKDHYGTFTPSDRLKVFALTDFATAMETVLMSDTYHDNFVALEGYKEVPYWQAGSTDDYASRSSILATVVTSMDGVGKKGTTADVDRSGIVFVMQDIDAVMTGSTQMDVDSLYNPDGRFWKYFYGHDMKFYNDLSENAIVYTIGTGTAPRIGGDALTLAKGSATGNTVVSADSAAGTGVTFKYAVVTDPIPVTLGEAAPTGFDSLTVGAAGTGTDITAGEGAIIQVVAIKSSKVISVGFKTVTADEVK